MAPAPESWTLYWNGRLLGRITEAAVCDWPWRRGRFAAVGEWPADLRASLAALARAAAADDSLPEPPLQSGHYDGWSVVDPAGAACEIGVPLIDFAAGEIEWR